jgi:penicillin-insensitive murein endopeptidase
MPIALTVAFTLMMMFVSANAAIPSNPWSHVRTPAPGTPEAVGFYSTGCLRGAASTLVDGPGYFSMRLSRHRFYGHPSMIRYIEDVGRQSVAMGNGAILVGDIAQPRGGPTFSGHASHQTGLDVDLWFYDPVPLKLSLEDRETLSAQDILSSDGKSLNPKTWSTVKKNLIRIAADHPEVERIFLDPLGKRALCQEYPGASWLRRIRPYWHHHDHIHVRLACPPDSPRCRPQEAVPPGDGCGEELAGWLGPNFAEERRKSESAPSEPFKMPRLPAECADILASP